MKKLFILLVALTFSAATFAQGVKVSANPGGPDASAIFEAESNTKGMLPPRMTSTERDAISTPAPGLMIYNTTTNCLNMWNGSSWKQACFDCIFSPPAVGNNGPVCEGNTLNLSASSVNGASYSWAGPNGFTSSLQNPSIPSITAANSGTYTLTTTLNGCSTTSTTLVTVNAQPDATYTYSPPTAAVATSTTFTPNIAGYSNYSWSIPNASPSSSLAFSPTVQWALNGTVDVILAVTDGNGCIGTSQQSITINCQALPLGQSTSFNYTGQLQTWTVPACVTEITIEAYGAQGGDGFRPGNQGSGGNGGYATGKKLVTPGTTLNIYVGQQGSGGQLGTGGWNGGGNGHAYSGSEAGGGGGGASDVRIGGTNLSDRVIIGGGGGGGSNTNGANGGIGGYPNGGNGAGSFVGIGGTQSGGGSGGSTGGNGGPGNAGTLGQGGDAGSAPSCGGGGGGGYYGGGGGGGCNSGGGGGGSSYIGGMDSNTSTTNGVRTGNGLVTISW